MKALYALMMVFSAAPALAGNFIPPVGCTTTLTVQSRGCYVANYYSCSSDAADEQWRADYDQEGMFYLSKIDFETQWIESYDLNPKVKQTLDPNPIDPANFSSLLSTGRDDFDFGLTKDTGEHTNVKGFDQLTGKTVTIDGVTLRQTQYEYVETDDSGTELRKANGNEYVSEQWRTFFAGPSQWWNGTEYLPMDSSPMQFIEPGEKGFAVTQPLFECDAVMSSLPYSPEIVSHDHL